LPIDGNTSSCEWAAYKLTGSPDSPDSFDYSAQLDIERLSTQDQFEQHRRDAVGKTTTVKHVGDDAFVANITIAGHAGKDLWVRTGQTVLHLEVTKMVGTKPLVKLATFVLAKL
jgi:hypothetical protein